MTTEFQTRLDRVIQEDAQRERELDERPDSIQQRFLRFHRKNPWVYDRLVELAREAKAAGRTKIGIGVIYEVARWYSLVRTTGEDYNLPDNFRSRYARLIMEQEEDLQGFFTTAKLRAR